MIETITYNYRTRKHEVRRPDGLTESFDGKRAALHYAVQNQNPRLFRFVWRMIQNHPQAENVAWRASELVLRGHVARQEGKNNLLALVQSQQETGGIYAVTKTGLLITCDCANYMMLQAPFVRGMRACKHIIAFLLVVRLSQRRCYHCKKLVDGKLEECSCCGELVTPF